MEKLNINKILSNYLQHWRYFLVSMVTSILLVFLFIRYWAHNEYAIEGKILVKNPVGGQTINENDSFNNYGLRKTANSLDDEIGILTSTGVMEEVISKNRLNISYHLEGNIRDVEIYGEDVPIKIIVDETTESLAYNVPIEVIFKDSVHYKLKAEINERNFSSEHRYGELIQLSYGTFTIVKKEGITNIENFRPLYFLVGVKEDYIENFIKKLKVFPANKTGSLLTLSFESRLKKKGEEILSKLIETYIDKTIKYENELAKNTIKMIDERLKLLSGEIDSVETSVVDFKTKNVITNVASDAGIFIQQSNEYKRQVMEYQTQIKVLEDIEHKLELGDINTSISGVYNINDPSLTSLIESYNETLSERKTVVQSAEKANPLVVNLESSLTNLRASILQNVRTVKNGFYITRKNLLANVGRYDAQIAKVPSMEKQLLDISRDKGTKEGLYLFLLQKREEEVLSLAAPVSSTRIVSFPKSSKYPVRPNKLSLYLGGLILGGFIPFASIYIKELFNNKVGDLEDINLITDVPYAGEICRNNKKEPIISTEGRVNPLAELFRLFIYNMDYLCDTVKNQTIMVTSTIKGEGKSFISSNLAVSLAANGEKVIIVAFDLREPQIMTNFELSNSPGVTDFIIKKGSGIEKVVQKHPSIDNLSLIGSGAITSQVGRLLQSQRIGILLNSLKAEYDRIIIDTAPIGLISDAYALNRYVNSTVYVVRKDVTKKEHLKTLDSIYKSKKLKNIMVVLNDTKINQSYGYGGYGKKEV